MDLEFIYELKLFLSKKQDHVYLFIDSYSINSQSERLNPHKLLTSLKHLIKQILSDISNYNYASDLNTSNTQLGTPTSSSSNFF